MSLQSGKMFLMRKIVLIILFIGTPLAISLIPPLKDYIDQWGPWAFGGLMALSIAVPSGVVLYLAYQTFFGDLREDDEKYDE